MWGFLFFSEALPKMGKRLEFRLVCQASKQIILSLAMQIFLDSKKIFILVKKLYILSGFSLGYALHRALAMQRTGEDDLHAIT